LDTVDKKTRSMIMRSIKSEDTKFENAFYSVLISNGINGLIKHPKNIFGKPDFIHNQAKIAIFLDSCFWHGCPEHCRVPHSNVEYWKKKIDKNKKRDKLVSETLRKEGWAVLRIWEHSLSDEKKVLTWVEKIKDLIQERLPTSN